MRRVFKYTMPAPGETGVRHIPLGATHLSVQMQGDEICLWVEVDPGEKVTEAVFHTVGTGWPIPEKSMYLGTVQEHSLVWHVYRELA